MDDKINCCFLNIYRTIDYSNILNHLSSDIEIIIIRGIDHLENTNIIFNNLPVLLQFIYIIPVTNENKNFCTNKYQKYFNLPFGCKIRFVEDCHTHYDIENCIFRNHLIEINEQDYIEFSKNILILDTANLIEIKQYVKPINVLTKQFKKQLYFQMEKFILEEVPNILPYYRWHTKQF